jgi:hypothetical protein
MCKWVMAVFHRRVDLHTGFRQKLVGENRRRLELNP